MNLLADHCVYGQTVCLLRATDHAVIWLKEIGKQEAEDNEVLQIARQHDAILISNDLDFGDILRYPPETHEGIIVLRIDPPESLSIIHTTLLNLLRQTDRELLRSALVIISHTGYRIRY